MIFRITNKTLSAAKSILRNVFLFVSLILFAINVHASVINKIDNEADLFDIQTCEKYIENSNSIKMKSALSKWNCLQITPFAICQLIENYKREKENSSKTSNESLVIDVLERFNPCKF